MNVVRADEKAEEIVSRAFSEAGIPADIEPGWQAGVDLVVHLPDSGERLHLEYHASVAPLQLELVARQLTATLPPGARGGLIVRRLTLALLDACKARGLCVFGLDGNAYARLPGVYVERYRPAAEGPRVATAGTCFTAKASRLLRALFDRYPRDITQADLARATGLSRGYVSILTSRLVNDGYVSNRSGLLYLEEPDRLLDAWAVHYRFDRHARSHWAVTMNSHEEGMAKVAAALRTEGLRYAYTGWSGALLRAPYAIADTVMAYVERLPEAPAGLHPVRTQGNVMLLAPQDEGVFQFTTDSKYGPVVCDAQLYIDLCRMPGRAREQADALRHERMDFARRLNGR